jgi:NDP-sugar pyrophosphorylase family protein
MWMDVGRPKDLLGANIEAAGRLFKDKDWGNAVKGSMITGSFYLGEKGKATDSELFETVISKGSSVSGSKVSRSLIMADCNITGAVITGSIIGEGCIVKKGARIIDSVLADGTAVNENETIEGTTGE